MRAGFIRRAAAIGMAIGLAAIPAATTASAVPPPAIHTPGTDHCPHRTHTPPAVDESEVVPPGSTTPTPLPVPSPAVGGDQLASCGVVADPAVGPLPHGLTSAGWLIADMASGRVIAAKDPHGRYRPASTIKVLLALVALKELDLSKVVVPTVEDWSTEGDSCGMGPGGHYTTRDLLTGLVMVSGNDCANALARELGGRDQTLEKMNKLVTELGARDTRAASPSGLDAPGMSTSPYDLALIFRAAMAEPTFRELIAMPTFKFPGYPKRRDIPGDKDHPPYDMYSSNQLVLEGYPGALGGKTGYTDDARKTFVGATERDGRTVMIVQMYGLSVAGDMYWDQAKHMFDYGFRAGSDVAVGELVSTAGTSSTDDKNPDATRTAPTGAPDPQTRLASSGSDTSNSTAMQILIGLIAAIIAVVLLLLGLRLFGKR